LCSLVGDWEKYCELSVDNGEWENAIMAAPNVSLSYWRELVKKYKDYCVEKSNKNKLIASLITGEIQPALKILSEAEEYEDAKMIWLTRRGGSVKIVEGISPNTDINITEIEKSLSDTILNDVINSIAKNAINKGLCIKAVCSYLSVKDFYRAFKTLIRFNELEIAFLLMKSLNYKVYEEDIVIGLALNELKKGKIDNYYSLIKTTDNIEIWIFLLDFISLYKNIQDPYTMAGLIKEDILALLDTKDILYFIASAQYDKVFDIFEASFDTVAQNLREAKFIKENYENLLKCLYLIRCLSPSLIDKSKKDRIYLKICIASSFTDSLNGNII
jgi:hypothetical protein